VSEVEMMNQAPTKSPEAHTDVGRQVVASKGTGWMVLAVACVLTAMVSIATTMWLLRDGTGRTNGAQQLVFIDAKRLIEAKALELNARRLPDSEHTAEGAKFADLLQSIVVDYQSKGYTVVNGGVLLSETDQNDLTEQVAKQMGIRLDIKELADASDGTR
jgi:flagellar basal body-associated protein FliL